MQRQNSSSEASPNAINTGVPKQNIVVSSNNNNNNTMASSYIRPRIAEWWWKENIQQHYYIQKLLQNQQQAPPLPDSAVPTFFEVVFDEADEYNKKQNAGNDDDDGYDDDVRNDNDDINTKILHQRFHVPPFPPRVLQSSRQFRVEVGNDQEEDAEAQSPVHENASSSSSTATLVEDDENLIDEDNLSDHKSNKKQRQEVANAPDAKNVADRLWEGHKTAMNFAESTPSDAAKSLSPLKESNGTNNKSNQTDKNNLPKRNQSALSLGSIALTNQHEQWVAVTTPAASTAEVLDWASASGVVVTNPSLNNNNKESSINRKQGQRTAPSPASTFATMTTTTDILALQQPHQRGNMQKAHSLFNNMISSPPTSTTNENNNSKQCGPLFPRSASIQLQNTKGREEDEQEEAPAGKESSFGFASYFTSAVARCLILTQELLMEHDRRNVEEEKAKILIKVCSYASNNNEELDAMDNVTVISQMKEQQQQEKNKSSVRGTPAEGDEKTSLAGGSSITKQQQKQTPSAGVDSSPFSVINLNNNNHSAEAVVGISISATPAILTTIEGEEVEEERNNINRNQHEDDQDADDDGVNSSWSACSQAGDSECEAHAATAVENWLKERQPNSDTNNKNNFMPAQNISSASAAAASLPLNSTARTTVGGIPLSQLKSEVYFRSVKSKNTAGPLGLMRQGISDASLYGDDSSVYSESQFAGNGNGGAQQQLPSPSRNQNACHRHHRDRNHVLQERSPFTNNNNNRTDRQRRSVASASNCSSKSTKTSSSLASPSSPPQPNQKENTNPFCDDDEQDEKEHTQDQQQNIINNNNNDHNAKVFSMADQEQRMRINANNNVTNNSNNNNNTEEVMDFISSASTLKSALKFALRSVARSALEEWVGVLPALVLLPHHYHYSSNNSYYHDKNQQNQNSVTNNNNSGNNKNVASSNESYQEQKANRKQGNNNNNSVKSPSNSSSNGGMLSSMLYSNRRNQTPEQEERLRQFMKTFYASQKNALVKNLVSEE